MWTQVIDSLRPYCHTKIHFSKGVLLEEIYNSVMTIHSSSYMTRQGEYINGDNTSYVAIPDFVAGAPINVFIRAKIDSIGSSNGHFLIKINTSVQKGFFLKVDPLRRLQMSQYCEDSSNVSNTVSSAIELGKWYTLSCEAQSDSVDGVRAFINGIQSGASGSTVGKTIRHLETTVMRIFGYAANQLARGVVSDILIFQNVILTPLQHAQISDELNNQIRYETDLFTINNDYPTVGSSVWEARYGILADEVTMTAGQPIGQFVPFKVSTGAHKMSTFTYNGQLAKGVQCVTAGNIIIPDPRPGTGTQFQYLYYTAATTTWAAATSATTTINLAAAGDIVLWSTYDGKNCLKKV